MMKRKFNVAVLLFIIGIIACSKPEDKTKAPVKSIPKSYWRLGNKDYKSVKAIKITDPFGIYFLKALDSIAYPDNTCTFSFKTYPTQNGTYKIVGTPNPKVDEVYVAVQKSSEWYYSINEDTAKAFVTVDSQKVSIRIPFIYLYTSGNYKLAEFTCNIIQTF